MARCDYDNVFYRVSCVTLLAVAFTFTVILTNVFVDIDTMISNKGREDISPLVETPKTELPIQKPYFLPDDESEDVYEDKDYQDSTDLYRSKRALDSQVVIKTATDITAPNDNRNYLKSIVNHSSNASGIIKLSFKGKFMKIQRTDEPAPINLNNTKTTEASASSNITQPPKEVQRNHFRGISYKRFINGYLKTLARNSHVEPDKMYSKKRLKRHIKVRYENKKTSPIPKANPEDDELFLEIETHFDTHGAKGEKKNKMIKELIDKIKTVIHSTKRKTHIQNELHVKKRMQNPLDNNGADFVNSVFPLDSIKHRQIDRISKSVPMHEKLPFVSGNKGDIYWQRSYDGPGSLAKTINSAELSTVDTDYEKILKSNGIPERLQIPLNSVLSEETVNSSGIDLGNIKLKNIEGTGFSIGFNQFQGEVPDPESLKLFTELENVVQTYRQKYDQEDSEIPSEYENPDSNTVHMDKDNVDEHPGIPDDVNNHVIARRSINTLNKSHHHVNEYKKIVDKLHFKKYKDIDTKHISDRTPHSVLVHGENVFEKVLNPSEIFLITDLFDRTKRSIQVKQISNVKSKMKISRYLNTNKIINQYLFHSKKRNKRQINKIRFVARDLSQHLPRDSEEDVLLVSDEKIFADRAVHSDKALLRGMSLPDIEHNKKVQTFEHYDIIAPQNMEENVKIIAHPRKEVEEHIDIINPFPIEERYENQRSDYMRPARLNSLMARYPHIIVGEIDSGEEPSFKYYGQGQAVYNDDLESTTKSSKPNYTDMDMSSYAPDLAELLVPQGFDNYKVTVKIKPKNITLNSGFKEVRTSINKSYNKNGLVYTSLVNVSEVSKVEKINKNATVKDGDNNLGQQQDIQQKQQDALKLLIRQHKLRIDEQLAHLNKEKKKLEDAFNIANGRILQEQELTTTSTQSVTNPKIKLATEGERIIKNTTPTVITTPKSLKITTEPIPTTTKDPERIKMMRTIERNENITNEILKKIDKNTGILETFLKKLLTSIYSMSQKQSLERKKIDNQKNIYTTEKLEVKMNNENINAEYNQNKPNNFYNHMQTKLNNTTFEGPYSNKGFDSKLPNISENIVHPNAPKIENYTEPNNNNVQNNKERENEVQTQFFETKPGEKVIHEYLIKNNTRFYFDD